MPDVGDIIKAENARWHFSKVDSEKFSKHIERSIPGYHEGHRLIEELSDFFIKKNSKIYDLGCSTGNLTHKIAARHADQKVKVIGVERERSLLQAARLNVENSPEPNLEYRKEDIIELELEPANLVIAYYTLQFLSLKNRKNILKRIWRCLNPGGAFLLFEKVREPNSRLQELTMLLYNDFKLQNGYSGDEIIAKSRSLKGVLEPLSSRENLRFLKDSGFRETGRIFKRLCFEGFIAIKK
tara:strand:+ start:1677 stop:2396 length:720 start_codon:yes stop_codon:yes gene_type:complete